MGCDFNLSDRYKGQDLNCEFIDIHNSSPDPFLLLNESLDSKVYALYTPGRGYKAMSEYFNPFLLGLILLNFQRFCLFFIRKIPKQNTACAI
ncbi:hypothetical protein Lmor_1382 [Legionella moravica]|uniref:Uncharacterized protein n=1 Tax=Legionella moravica TaxID=39962 RepID=A0A378JZQ8_9GAMM|nr:hypothetical protein Lmor_1382 [Legionella moravica]STX63906.1 Uncharacterised protein [Legionella moravica]